MPKMTQPHKQKNPSSAARHRGTRSIGDLLTRSAPILSRIGDQSARQAFWRGWLSQRLPAGLAERVSGVTERDGELWVFAESAAWSARLRYAMQELDAAVREADPNVKQVVVRVLPRGSAALP